MAQFHVGGTCDITFVAEEDLSAKQYRIIKFGTAAYQAKVATTASEAYVGVLQNAPASGEQAVVRISGPSKLYVNGTTDIAAGDGIESTTAGVGVKNTTDKHRIIGFALESMAENADRVIEVLVNVQTQSV